MNTLINLFYIAVIIVFITDLTDFPDTVKKVVSFIGTKGKIVKTDFRIHLVDCSLCQIWWTGLIYLLVTSNFTLPYIGFVCLLAFFSNTIKNSIILIEDIFVKIIQIIYNFLDR